MAWLWMLAQIRISSENSGTLADRYEIPFSHLQDGRNVFTSNVSNLEASHNFLKTKSLLESQIRLLNNCPMLSFV